MPIRWELIDCRAEAIDVTGSGYQGSLPGPGKESIILRTVSPVHATNLRFENWITIRNQGSKYESSRLLKAAQEAQASELGDLKRSQLGGGGRSEKIRTYNFKENRVTEHRINLTNYSLDAVLAGDLDPYIDALLADKRARQLAESDGR